MAILRISSVIFLEMFFYGIMVVFKHHVLFSAKSTCLTWADRCYNGYVNSPVEYNKGNPVVYISSGTAFRWVQT